MQGGDASPKQILEQLDPVANSLALQCKLKLKTLRPKVPKAIEVLRLNVQDAPKKYVKVTAVVRLSVQQDLKQRVKHLSESPSRRGPKHPQGLCCS